MTFALILFSLLLLTGVIWLLDRFMLRAKRPAGVTQPWWVEYAISFFPVISDRICLAFIFGRAVQDTFRLDDPDFACGRFHSGESFYLRPASAHHQQEVR